MFGPSKVKILSSAQTEVYNYECHKKYSSGVNTTINRHHSHPEGNERKVEEGRGCCRHDHLYAHCAMRTGWCPRPKTCCFIMPNSCTSAYKLNSYQTMSLAYFIMLWKHFNKQQILQPKVQLIMLNASCQGCPY